MQGGRYPPVRAHLACLYSAQVGPPLDMACLPHLYSAQVAPRDVLQDGENDAQDELVQLRYGDGVRA